MVLTHICYCVVTRHHCRYQHPGASYDHLTTQIGMLWEMTSGINDTIVNDIVNSKSSTILDSVGAGE